MGANKASIACRMDCFSEEPNPIIGAALKKQVEDRLSFFETGTVPQKNVEAMKDACGKMRATMPCKTTTLMPRPKPLPSRSPKKRPRRPPKRRRSARPLKKRPLRLKKKKDRPKLSRKSRLRKG